MGNPNFRVLLAMLALLLAGITACTTSGVSRFQGLALSEEPLTGKFVWHDLITDDVDQVKRFYGGVFGWSFEDTMRPNGGDYTLIMSGERFVGGIVHLDDPADVEYSRWLGYLSVDDVDRAVGFTRARQGRAVVGPLDVTGIGRAAVIQDPQNAVVGLLRSDHGDPDDSLAPGPGVVVWNELLAADDEAATGFYGSLAGLREVGEKRSRGVYYVLESQGRKRAGVMQRPSEDIEPFWLTHFGVGDVASATGRVEELGGEVLLGPDPDLRNGQVSVVVDPSGAILALHQWTQ